jgi:thiosulfate reductase cytochrome b subunit
MVGSAGSARSAFSAQVDKSSRHTALVRITHWISALCFFALLVTGIEIIISHPRFYWGETGNVNMAPLFSLPVPASRSAVPTGYGFVLPDQNGWSRSLHFEAAWVLVFTGFLYVVYGLATKHFWKNLVPDSDDISRRALAATIVDHLRFKRPEESEAWRYNTLQRLAYLSVIFLLVPLAIWTGLAMSPAVVSAFPSLVTSLGGQQSARTIHFFVSLLLLVFVVVHLIMISMAGFAKRTRMMIAGNVRQGRSVV